MNHYDSPVVTTIVRCIRRLFPQVSYCTRCDIIVLYNTRTELRYLEFPIITKSPWPNALLKKYSRGQGLCSRAGLYLAGDTTTTPILGGKVSSRALLRLQMLISRSELNFIPYTETSAHKKVTSPYSGSAVAGRTRCVLYEYTQFNRTSARAFREAHKRA